MFLEINVLRLGSTASSYLFRKTQVKEIESESRNNIRIGFGFMVSKPKVTKIDRNTFKQPKSPVIGSVP